MSQINVNTPGEPTGSGGMGMIVGVILAVLVIGALVYFLLLSGERERRRHGEHRRRRDAAEAWARAERLEARPPRLIDGADRTPRMRKPPT